MSIPHHRARKIRRSIVFTFDGVTDDMSTMSAIEVYLPLHEQTPKLLPLHVHIFHMVLMRSPSLVVYIHLTYT